jgi:5-methylthioadenosine/S-adenosylhomocysteine deaminase
MIDSGNTSKGTSNSADIILRNGLILTEPGKAAVEHHEMTVISDGRLVEVNVSHDTHLTAETTIDCSGCLLMPGLVNGHNHAAMSLLRGLADDLPLDRWLSDYIFPSEGNFVAPDFVYTGTVLSAMEMVLNGITTFADGYYFVEQAAQAAIDIGLRAVIAQGILDVPVPDAPTPGSWKARVEEFLSECPRHALVEPALFCHSPYLCGPDTLQSATEMARHRGILLFSHVSETSREADDLFNTNGRRPVEHLHDLGVLGPDFVAVHAVHLSEREKDLLLESNTKVVHCPESNMKLASGACPAWELSQRGVTLGIGTDGPASNNNLDLFEEMRSASLMAKLITGDPEALGADVVLRMATIDGARVLGMADRIGSLEPGKFADLIVIDLDRPHLTPLYAPSSHLVYVARGSDVRDVIVNGKHVVDHGKIITVDEQEIKARARILAAKIGRDVGVEDYGKFVEG